MSFLSKTRNDVFQIINEAAIETQRNIQPVSNYEDHRHNQYFNEFSKNLHGKLQSKGINMVREKTIDGGLKPDIFIEGIGVVEVKSKGHITTEDRETMGKYVAKTKLPGVLVNFGTQGKSGTPNVREFN